MNTRSNRMHRDRSILRRWLSGAMSLTRGQYDSRRLSCEQLERRYALHGMGWSDDSFGFDETRDSFDGGVGAHYGAMHSGFHRTYNYSAQFEGEDRDSFGGIDSLDDSVDDSTDQYDGAERLNHDCDRSHGRGGMRAEGEFGSSNLFRPNPGRAVFNGLHPTPGSGAASGSDSHFNKPEEKLVDSTGLGSTRPNFADGPGRVESPSIKPSDPPAPVTANNDLRTSSPTRLTSVESQLLDFMGSASRQADAHGNGTNQNLAIQLIPEGNSSIVSEGAVNRVPASPSLLSSSKTALTTETTPTTSVLRSNLTIATASVASLANKSESLTSQSTTTTHTWQRLSESTDSSTARLNEAQTDGLLDRLRSVIDEFAIERQSDKFDAPTDSRLNHALSSGHSDDMSHAARQPSLIDDGMLELAAATEELDSSAELVAGSDNASAAKHRGQLLASLELTREFELAGQTVDALHSVVTPAANVQAAQRAAHVYTPWSESDDLAAADSRSASTGSAEGSIWQRSLIPLSFLAAGLLLTKKRRQALLQGLPLMPRISRTKAD